VVCEGTIANLLTDRTGAVRSNTNITPGVGNYLYQNDQPSATIWYHDHSLGMTRLNVMAGPAGFWLIRDGVNPTGETGLVNGILPGPAPVRGEDLIETNVAGRHKYREIPIVIQGRSFNADGSLYYPDNRAFFEGLNVEGTAGTAGAQFPGEPELRIDMDPLTSDIAPIWNPEAFFNTMVVNGVTWPKLEVAPAQYRFRLLNGTNARFLNLALKITDADGNPVSATKTYYTPTGGGRFDARTVSIDELNFYQIGAEQSLKPTVTAIRTAFATNLSTHTLGADGQVVNPTPQSSADQALLMGVAERADVIVDFRGLPDGTIITMTNTAADSPFGGFPDTPADPATTGQVMRFVVNSVHLGLSPTDELRDSADNGYVVLNPAIAASNVTDLVVDPAALHNFDVVVTNLVDRQLALIEEESALICVDVDVDGNLVQLQDIIPLAGVCPQGEAFAPKAAVLGTVDVNNGAQVTLWSDPITTNVNANGSGNSRAEQWNLWNFTVDGHPIHVHLVAFKVLGRYAMGGDLGDGSSVVTTSPNGVEAWEDGWKDTVITYPGEVTSIEADFDINGLYVWHCHIVEHEDNEMMVPMCVGVPGVDCPIQLF
jgi:FtsP/CotA-like multicopper oxidase with cupredoxin domain